LVIHHAEDITERKRAEKEGRFQAKLLDTVGQAIIATDPQGKVLYWNRAAEELYGWSAEEVIGLSIMEVTPSEEMVERAEEIMAEILAGRSWSGEVEVRRKDGTTFPALVTDAPVHDERGNLMAIIGISTDITEIKQTEELRRSEERFRLLAENAQDLIALYRFKPAPGFEYVSPSSTAITGYTPEEYYADPELGYKIAHPDDRHLLDETLHHPEAPSVIRWIRKDGRVVWTEQRNKPIHDEAGELVAIEGIARDVTERVRAEEALMSSEEFFRALYENAQHPIFLLDRDLNFVDVNPYACQFYGYSREEFRRINASDITLPEEQDDQLRNLEIAHKQGRVFIRERRHRKKNGEIVTVTADAARVTRSGKELYVSKITDITERKALEEELTYQAFHDQLTRLPNRHLFMDRLGQALKHMKGRKVAILFMDLDNFKAINDSLGHEVGDRLLVALSERLKGCLRPADTLARFGGDEFMVLLEDIESPDEAVRVAERITEELRGRFVLDGRELFLRGSIGIALSTSRAKSSKDLLRDADTAMYRAKEGVASGYRVFDPPMHELVMSRLGLENDLRGAIEQQEFRLFYQPIVRFKDEDAFAEVEALLRWQHPQRGLLMPEEFIPLAEETGLIIPIGRWVLNEACRQVKEWQDLYPMAPPLVACVNVSAGQLRYPDLLHDVDTALGESGIEARSLALEITEGAVVNDMQTGMTLLKELRDLGVRFAVDDFGSEYSSLSYLMRLPVDFVKIDKSFVWGLGEDPRAAIIVEAIISLAHSLGLEAVGEGVESAEQLENLRSMGCDLVQGNYLARPLPSEEVQPLLEKGLIS
ncbi:MAG TPA: EAL domain-containing protein, partial [Rubrobacter sp.]|nr:EAL domain-containing protein [Rubrobacter sp.]